MSKYTPGPWISHVSKVDEFTGNEVILVRSEKSMCGIVGIEDDHDDARGNAQLIAAAPELLEVAKLILKEWESPVEGVQRGELIGKLSQYAHAARAAVQKAEGK